MSGKPVGRFEWEQLLRETPGLSMAFRGVLSLMATYADYDTGEKIKPSLTKVAKRLEVPRCTLTKYVGDGVRLEWLGYTEDNSRHGKPSVYHLTRPEGGESNMSHPLAVSLGGGGDCIDRHPLTADTSGGDCIDRQGVTAGCRTIYTDTSTSTYTSTSTEPTGAAAWVKVEADAGVEATAAAESLAEAMEGAPDF